MALEKVDAVAIFITSFMISSRYELWSPCFCNSVKTEIGFQKGKLTTVALMLILYK